MFKCKFLVKTSYTLYSNVVKDKKAYLYTQNASASHYLVNVSRAVICYNKYLSLFFTTNYSIQL